MYFEGPTAASSGALAPDVIGSGAYSYELHAEGVAGPGGSSGPAVVGPTQGVYTQYPSVDPTHGVSGLSEGPPPREALVRFQAGRGAGRSLGARCPAPFGVELQRSPPLDGPVTAQSANGDSGTGTGAMAGDGRREEGWGSTGGAPQPAFCGTGGAASECSWGGGALPQGAGANSTQASHGHNLRSPAARSSVWPRRAKVAASSFGGGGVMHPKVDLQDQLVAMVPFLVLNILAEALIVGTVLLKMPLVVTVACSVLWAAFLAIQIIPFLVPEKLLYEAVMGGRGCVLQDHNPCQPPSSDVPAAIHGRVLYGVPYSMDASGRTFPGKGAAVFDTRLHRKIRNTNKNASNGGNANDVAGLEVFVPSPLLEETVAMDFILEVHGCDGEKALVRARDACAQDALRVLVDSWCTTTLENCHKSPGFLDELWRQREGQMMLEDAEKLPVTYTALTEGQKIAVLGVLKGSMSMPGQRVIVPMARPFNITPLLRQKHWLPLCYPKWISGLLLLARAPTELPDVV